MEVRIEKRELEKSLSKIKGVSGRQSNIAPILEHALFLAKDSLELVATDLEVGVKINCSAEVVEQGRTALLTRKVHEIVKGLEDGEVRIKSKEDNKVSIRSGSSKFTVFSADPEEYPSVSFWEGTELMPVDSAMLKSMIKKTIFAVAKMAMNSSLMGVLFESDGQNIRMVATDGHRLAKIEKPFEADIPDGTILPRKGLNELLRLLDDKDKVLIGFKGNNMVAQVGDSSITIRMLEGTFPDYKKIIPEDYSNEIIINKKGFMGALKRMALISQFVKFDISTDKMILSAVNTEYGEGTEVVPMNYNGASITIRLNQDYLMDVLNVIDSDDVRFSLKDGASPAVLEPLDGENLVNIVMPVRLE